MKRKLSGHLLSILFSLGFLGGACSQPVGVEEPSVKIAAAPKVPEKDIDSIPDVEPAVEPVVEPTPVGPVVNPTDNDQDGDGFDAIAAGGSDCDDNDPSVYEMKDYSFYDADGDGLRVPLSGTICAGAQLPAAYSQIAGSLDCNDASINPLLSKQKPYYADVDGDGLGGGVPILFCPGENFGSRLSNGLDNNDAVYATAFDTVSRILLESSAPADATATTFRYVGDWNLDGSVSALNPPTVYFISTPAQWLDFRAQCSTSSSRSCSANVILLRNIVFGNGNIIANGVTYIDDEPGTAGFQSSNVLLARGVYQGTLDGSGFSIQNLHYKMAAESLVGGIVGRAVNSALIRDIGFKNGGIIGLKQVGGIASALENSARLYHSYNASDLSIADGSLALRFIGGLASTTEPVTRIEGCYNTGAISSLDKVAATLGGLVGEHWGIMKTSFNSGSITGVRNTERGGVGGLIGASRSTSVIEDVYNVGDVIHEDAAGLIGNQSSGSTLTRSYNAGRVMSVTARWSSSAFVGWNDNLCTGLVNGYFLQTETINAGLPEIGFPFATSAVPPPTCTGSPFPITSISAMKNAANFSGFGFWNGSVGVWDILSGSGSYPFLRGVTPTAIIPGL